MAGDLGSQVGSQITAGANRAGFGGAADPRIIIAEIVQVLLGFVGTFFIVLVLMAGYWYITSRGDESKVEKATKTVRGAIIGLIIVLLAYSITRFISSAVQGSLQKQNPREAVREALEQNRSNP